MVNYEKGLDKEKLLKLGEEINMEEHVRLCQFGIARTNIKIGDFRRGVSLFSKGLEDARRFKSDYSS